MAFLLIHWIGVAAVFRIAQGELKVSELDNPFDLQWMLPRFGFEL